MIVEQFDLGAMQSHDSGDQTQAQSAAGGASIAFQPDERFQYSLAFRWRHAWSVVGNTQRDLITRHRDADFDTTAVVYILERVLDQIHERLCQ